MTELARVLRCGDPDRLVQEAIGLAALASVILVALFLPGIG